MQKGQTEILIGLIAVILITASAATELFKPANETATENQNTYLKDLTDEQKEVQEKIEKENEKNAISDYALNEVSIPQNVQAVPGPTVGQITITWNKVLDADYYNVSWRTGNNVGAFHHIPLNIMTDSFNFEEKKYYYQVKACNQSDECSEYSEWVSAYPQIGVEINAPSVAETNNWILISAEVELTDYPEFQWSFNGNSSCFSQGLNQEELRIKCTEKGNVFVSVTVNSQEKNIAEDSVSIKIIEDEINIVPDTPEIVGARP